MTTSDDSSSGSSSVTDLSSSLSTSSITMTSQASDATNGQEGDKIPSAPALAVGSKLGPTAPGGQTDRVQAADLHSISQHLPL